jgi:hypothetical protein
MFVGIDVSKDRLDVHVLPSDEAFAVARHGEGLHPEPRPVPSAEAQTLGELVARRRGQLSEIECEIDDNVRGTRPGERKRTCSKAYRASAIPSPAP